MKNKVIKEIVIIAIYIALLTIFSWISIPSIVPFTLQTFMIFIIAYTLKLKSALCVVVIYLVLGIIGVPVFSSFNSGLSYFLGSTGGFLLGFIPMVVIINVLSIKNNNETKVKNYIYQVLISLLGLIICYIMGLVWFMFIYKAPYTLSKALFAVIIPFIVPDIIKMVIAMIVSKRIKTIFYPNN